MDSYVISGFPGIGKSYFANHRGSYSVIDVESSDYSWIKKPDGTKERNPLFPQNYIDYIKSLFGKYTYILVSSHEVVRQALHDEGIEFSILYPDPSLKEIYLKNYKDRGNDEAFIKMMDEKWDDFIKSIKMDKCKSKFALKENVYLKDFAIFTRVDQSSEFMS